LYREQLADGRVADGLLQEKDFGYRCSANITSRLQRVAARNL
jgi:hypothetical protein